VSAQPLEIQMARLEGASVQIADRLNGIDHRLESIEQRFDGRFGQVDGRFAQIDSRFARLEQRVDSNLKTIISWMLGQTAVILAALAAAALHR
jgi:tetrahydromethanopterin S-methyltransferase subunit G